MDPAVLFAESDDELLRTSKYHFQCKIEIDRKIIITRPTFKIPRSIYKEFVNGGSRMTGC